MDWTPGDTSSDIEDRRDSSGGGGGFNFGGGGGLGVVGFVVLLVLSLVTGRNFLGSFFGGSGSGAPQSQTQVAPARQPGLAVAHPAGEERDVKLISFVLDDAQKTWTQIFAAKQLQYRHAKLVIYRGQTFSGCGNAQASTGPFYCPQDEKVYIDLSFWDELRKLGGDTSDFAQSYVIAHELGHHVQKLLGIEAKESRLVQTDPSERNALSVDLELQADCFAGVWAHSTEQRKIVDDADIEGALKAAAAVGDDHLQKMSGRAVSPESFTHGSSAQRTMWFKRGLSAGKVGDCSTFGGKLSPGN